MSSIVISKVSGLKFSNAYVIVQDDGLTLVDTGTSSDYESIISFLGSIGKNITDIKLIILTHSDADHSGSAARLRHNSGAKIAIHRLDASRVSGKKQLKEVNSRVGGLLLKTFNMFMKFDAFEPDIIVEDGDTLGQLKVIHVPGHTEGSICLYLPNIALFSGDTLRIANGRVSLPSNYLNFDSRLIRNSVKKLGNLKYNQLCPGHGEPIMNDADKEVAKLIDSLH